MEAEMAFFPCDMEDGGIGGGILRDANGEPSKTGSLVYLNGGDDRSVPLSRVEKAGGKILLPKTSIGPHGFMAHFIDTEGNKFVCLFFFGHGILLKLSGALQHFERLRAKEYRSGALLIPEHRSENPSVWVKG